MGILSGIKVSPDMAIRCSYTHRIATVFNVTVRCLIKSNDRFFVISNKVAGIANTNTSQLAYCKLEDGELISVDVTVDNQHNCSSFAFGILSIAYLQNGSFVDYCDLCTGYFGVRFPLTYPNNQNEKSIPFNSLYVGNVSAPSAGNEIIFTSISNANWRIISAVATLVTDATVATRYVGIVFKNGTDIYFWNASGFDHVASTTHIYCFSNAPIGTGAKDKGSTILVPDTFFPANFYFATLTDGIKAGDQWSSLYFVVELFLNPTV